MTGRLVLSIGAYAFMHGPCDGLDACWICENGIPGSPRVLVKMAASFKISAIIRILTRVSVSVCVPCRTPFADTYCLCIAHHYQNKSFFFSMLRTTLAPGIELAIPAIYWHEPTLLLSP